jgi:two-component system, response regulator YesN
VDKSEEYINKIRLAISSIAQEEVRQILPCEVVSIGQDIVVVMDVSANNKNSLNELLTGIRNRIGELTDTSVTIALGLPSYSFREINQSYRYALMALNYRIVHGEGTILSYKDTVLKIKYDCDYPNKKEKYLLDSIRLGKNMQIEEALNDIFNYLKSCYYDFIILSVNHLLFAVYLTIDMPFNSFSEQNNIEFNEMLYRLRRLETLDQMKIWLMNYINFKVIQNLNSKRNSNTELAEEIKQYIKSNLASTDLSIDVVARRFNYHPIYFSKLFKEMFSKTYLEYVTDMKLNSVNEFLLDQRMTIKDVGIKAGFNNSTYFTTWYRKNTGFSPGEYRKEMEKIE